MDHSLFMGVSQAQAACDMHSITSCMGRLPLAQGLLEVFTVEMFHDDVRRTIVLVGVVGANHVGMVSKPTIFISRKNRATECFDVTHLAR